jgi:hypothetical protein
LGTILALAKAMSIQARRSSEREDQSRDDNDDEQEEGRRVGEGSVAASSLVGRARCRSGRMWVDGREQGLLRDVLSALVPYTTSPAAWKLRLEWATHIADVQFQ